MATASRNELKQIVRFMRLLFAVVMVGALVLVFFVPYGVDVVAPVDELRGELTLVDEMGNPLTLAANDAPDVTLSPGNQLTLPRESRARVEIAPELGAFAHLFGPVTWELNRAERRATAYEHVMQPTAAAYEVEIIQTRGEAVYDFSQARIPLADFNLTIRTLEQVFTPETDCFQVFAERDGMPARLAEIPCSLEAG